MADTKDTTIDTDLVSESIRDLFKKLLQESGIIATNIDIQAGSVKGDNYLGIIAKADVTGTDKNGENFRDTFIIKSAPKSEGFRKLTPIHLAYEREIYVYSHVIPAFQKFQSNKQLKNIFKSYAQCLKTSEQEKEEALIMRDMKALGFQMKDRKFALDYNHVKLVMMELAKLHSLSFALRDQKPEIFNVFADKMAKNYFCEMDLTLMDDYAAKQCDKAGDVLDPNTDKDAIEKFAKFKESYVYYLTKLLEDQCHPYSVIRHGDCWTNNFLFAYKDVSRPTEPTSLCFLDWQISHVGPPVIDLFYFMYACTDQKIRDEHFDQLIKDYYQTMKEFTAELGSDLEKLYPYSVLEEQMLKFGKYGLATAIMLLQFLLSDAEDIPDINKVFDDGDMVKAMEAFTFESKNSEIYNKRMRDIILDVVEKKYI